MGKPLPGLTTGALHWPGAFELCEGIITDYNYTEKVEGGDVMYEEERHLEGHYCRVALRDKGVRYGFFKSYYLCTFY